MAIPSGSGTEVLKRASQGYTTNTDENAPAIFTSTSNQNINIFTSNQKIKIKYFHK